MKKMDELADKQIPVRWVLIDDGWLDADYKKQVLKGLDAAADKFPQGLGACVNKLKKEYGISQVGVWHAVMGYWNGLEPGSPAREALQEGSRVLEDGRIVPDAEAGKAFRFYDTWHDYLRTYVISILSRWTVRVRFLCSMQEERNTAGLPERSRRG